MRRRVTIETRAGVFPGYLCLSDTCRSPKPGLLFFHGSDGYGPQHGEVGDQLADRERAAVLIPQWFGAGSPHDHWSQLTWDDLRVFWAFLGALPQVACNRRGLIGFSRGGGVAVAAASRLDDVRCVVDFFGPTSQGGGMDGLGLGEDETLAFVAGIGAPVLALHGEADDVVPVGDTRRLEGACQRLGVVCEAVCYPGVGHSFVWPDNDRFDPFAATDAWNRVHDLLCRTLAV